MTFRCATVPTLVLLVATGCSGKSEDEWTKDRAETVPVTGVVKLGGEPVEGATVNFHAKSQPLAAYGRTDASGRFTLTTYEDGDGAVPGEHVVTIKKVETNTKLNPNDPEAEPLSTSETWIVPQTYARKETTDQSAKVTEDGENDFEFDLKGR